MHYRSTLSRFKSITILYRFSYNKQEDTRDTWFCSQLAAAILKDLNILPREIAFSANYLPADFSQARDGGILKLQAGFSLSEEEVIQVPRKKGFPGFFSWL